MWIKNHQSVARWRFVLIAPNKQEVVVHGNNIHDLANNVILQIAQWDGDGFEYSKRPREEAEKLGVDWYNYITKCIEHQICIREKHVQCWKGRGDNLHEFFKGVDSFIDSLPKPIMNIGRKVTQGITLLATGTAQRRFGNCRTCGGGKKFMDDGKNLGRKERLN